MRCNCFGSKVLGYTILEEKKLQPEGRRRGIDMQQAIVADRLLRGIKMH